MNGFLVHHSFHLFIYIPVDLGDDWGDDLMNDLEIRFNELRRFNRTLEESPDKDDVENITLDQNKMKEDTIELVANQIYDIITKLINERRERLGIKNGAYMVEPIRDYNNFDLDDNGNLTFVVRMKS